MKSTVIGLLVIANLILAGVLLARHSRPNAAMASQAAQRARPGEYIMIPGEVSGGNSAVVYLVDTANGYLSALAYDDSTKRLQAMPNRIDLGQVFSSADPKPEPPGKPGRPR